MRSSPQVSKYEKKQCPIRLCESIQPKSITFSTLSHYKIDFLRKRAEKHQNQSLRWQGEVEKFAYLFKELQKKKRNKNQLLYAAKTSKTTQPQHHFKDITIMTTNSLHNHFSAVSNDHQPLLSGSQRSLRKPRNPPPGS